VRVVTRQEHDVGKPIAAMSGLLWPCVVLPFVLPYLQPNMSGFITRYPAQPSSSGTPGPTTTPSKNVTSPPKDDKLNTNIAATYAPPSHHNTKFQIDENAAAKAMQFLIVSQLRNAGFDSGEPEVLITIERLVGSCKFSWLSL